MKGWITIGEIVLKNDKCILWNSECIEALKNRRDNSVDSIVTDPPYELGFMGKTWDSTGIAYSVDMWKECLRVLKPGGHLLAFGGTRTYHRMACAIEDAGFEIRDQIQWLYGSGFPKSYDISKGIDKQAGVEREVVSVKDYRSAFNCSGTHQAFEGETHSAPVAVTKPSTKEAIRWNGWGTALKPANEPICMARKPISEKTVSENVLKWGTGGINIDACRIETTDNLNGGAYSGGQRCDGDWKENSGFKNDKLTGEYQQPTGRFPANIILDEEAGKILDGQSGISKSTGGCGEKSKGALGKSVYGKYALNELAANAGGLGDVGGASRFFYCAKASKKEKGNDNNHPTVKPVKLMEYLVKLVTPENGICLDPFAGSGTTGVAAIAHGMKFIGIELDPTYCDIAKKRIQEAKREALVG